MRPDEQRPEAEGLLERQLVIEAATGDEEACRRLIEAFLPAIVALARPYDGGHRIERQELLQEGVAGLLFAARRYDARLNTPFWAYASFWVRKAMQELVAELTRPIVLSDRAARAAAQIRNTRRAHIQAHGREPTVIELSQATGLGVEQIESLAAAERVPRALEEPIGLEGEPTTTVGETIADPLAEREYDRVLDSIEIHEVHGLAAALGDRERSVLLAHYGLGQAPQTLNQIGERLGLTAERVRQIEMSALQQLRAALTQPAAVALESA